MCGETAASLTADIPLDEVRKSPDAVISALEQRLQRLHDTRPSTSVARPHAPIGDSEATPTKGVDVLIVCRRGHDSNEALTYLQASESPITFADVPGGLRAYAALHPTFPMY